MESGLVEDHSTPQGVVQPQFTSPVVSTAGYVEELLDIRLEVQTVLIFVLIVKLDLMVLALLMELNTIIFGVMWLV